MRSARRFISSALILAAASLATLSGAQAVNQDVKSACKGDYFRHCASHEVGSEALRQCMRTVGENLSTPCLVALVKAGEITKKDIDRHNAAKAGGQAAKVAEPQKTKSKTKVAQQEKTKAKAVDAQKQKANAKLAQAQKPKANSKVALASTSTKMPPNQQVSGAKSKAKMQAAANDRKATAQIKPPKTTASASKYAKVTDKPDFTQAPPRKAKAATYDTPIASEPEVAYTHNLCRAKRLNGTVTEFTCGLDQRCCYLQLSDQEYCRPLDKPCF